MPQKIQPMLELGDRETRIKGWNEIYRLRADHRRLRLELDAPLEDTLLSLMEKEKDHEVFRAATLAMMALVCSGVIGVEKSARRSAAKPPSPSVADKLWSLFQKPTVVFSTKTPNYEQRDAQACFHFGQRLGPSPKFPSFDVGDSSWEAWLSDGTYYCLCILGRLGLYGKAAVRELACKDPRMRFEFASQFRPAGLPPNELSEEYHRIIRTQGVGDFDQYITEDRDGTRTDFAIVQSYVIQRGGRIIRVMHCAGGTKLGTLGAARWVAIDLFNPIGGDAGGPIPAPGKMKGDCFFEALLKVTGEQTGETWVPKLIEPLELYVNDSRGPPQECKWQEIQVQHIKIVCEDENPVKVFLDDRLLRMQRDKPYIRLTLAMAEQKRTSGNSLINEQALADDTWIWGGARVTLDDVRDKLIDLKNRHLRSALSIDEPVHLLASAEIEGDYVPAERRR